MTFPKLLVLLFLLPLSTVFAQQEIGKWRYHAALYNMKYHAVAGDVIYAGNDLGTFYKYTPNDGSIKTLSQIDGFADHRVSYLNYSSNHQILIVGYLSGQIDLVKGNQILNVNDIYRNETITGSKRINHINIEGNIAYLSTDFGVVVLDYLNGLIKETYRYIGPNGSEPEVISSALINNNIYICTSQSVQVGSMNGSNLSDFNNWVVFDASQNTPNDSIVGLATNKDSLFLVSGSKMQTLQAQNWIDYQSYTRPITGLKQGENNFAIAYSDSVSVYDQGHTIYQSSNYTTITDASWQNNELIVSDSTNGLIINEAPLSVNSPLTNNYVSFKHSNGVNYFLPNQSNEAFYAYNNHIWGNYQGITNVIDAAYSSRTNKTYFATMGNGLKSQNGDNFESEDSASFPTAPDGKVYISALQPDYDGYVWGTVYSSTTNAFTNSIFKVTEEEIIFYNISFNQARNVKDFRIDAQGVLWMLSEQGNIIVFNPETSQLKVYYHLTNNIIGRALSIDLSTEGNILIGTQGGLSIAYNTANVFTNPSFTFSRPIIGDQYLLNNQTVSSIQLDGGGNLWAGTTTGIYFFDKSFSEQIFHFTSSNSPLLSNNVTFVGFDETNGEVFIQTAEGLFSYQGFSTDATLENKDQVNIFPNPVHPTYNGVVAIRGLARNVNVKITDLAGNLAYETYAEGGTAAWDMNLLSGERATTGVYLIFATDTDGNETFVGKLAIINQ
ncbi:hypothetical protein OAH12_01905 [Cyclobacteriaceae bacterium]|nr:hypothetical protein [Cyclobacteriaceae bacterium]